MDARRSAVAPDDHPPSPLPPPTPLPDTPRPDTPAPYTPRPDSPSPDRPRTRAALRAGSASARKPVRVAPPPTPLPDDELPPAPARPAHSPPAPASDPEDLAAPAPPLHPPPDKPPRTPPPENRDARPARDAPLHAAAEDPDHTQKPREEPRSQPGETREDGEEVLRDEPAKSDKPSAEDPADEPEDPHADNSNDDPKKPREEPTEETDKPREEEPSPEPEGPEKPTTEKPSEELARPEGPRAEEPREEPESQRMEEDAAPPREEARPNEERDKDALPRSKSPVPASDDAPASGDGGKVNADGAEETPVKEASAAEKSAARAKQASFSIFNFSLNPAGGTRKPATVTMDTDEGPAAEGAVGDDAEGDVEMEDQSDPDNDKKDPDADPGPEDDRDAEEEDEEVRRNPVPPLEPEAPPSPESAVRHSYSTRRRTRSQALSPMRTRRRYSEPAPRAPRIAAKPGKKRPKYPKKGDRIRVLWHVDNIYYEGVVDNVLTFKNKRFYDVTYESAEREYYVDFSVRKWRFVDSKSDAIEDDPPVEDEHDEEEELDEDLFPKRGDKVKIMWHVDGKYYAGVIKDVLRVGKRLFHDVSYDKGDLEFFLDLKVRKWRYQNPDSEGDGEEESESATASKRTKSTSKGKKTSSRRTSRQRPASDEVLSGGSPSPLLRRVGRGDAPLFGGSTQKARGKPRKSLPPRFADDPRARESSFSPPLSPLGVPSLDTPPSLESPVLPILSRSPSEGRGDGMGSGTGRLPDPGDFDKDILNLIVDEVDVPLPDLFELPRKRSRGQDIDAITANLVERKKQKAAELPGVEMDLIQTPPGKRSSSSIAKEDGDAIAPGDSGTGKLHSTELEDTEVINLQSPDEQKRMAGEDGNRPDTDADRSPKSKEDSRPPETRQLAVRQPGGVVPVSGPAPDGRRLAVRKPDTRQLAVRQPETRQLAVRRPEDRVLAVRQQPSRQLAVRNDSAPSNMVDSRHSAGSLTREVPVSRRRSLDVEYIDDRRRPKTRVSDIVSVAGLVARKWASEEVAVLMRRIQTSRKQVHNIRKYQAAAEKTLRKRVKQIERIEQEEEERTRDLPKTAQNADAYLDLEAHLGSFKEDLVDQVKRYRRTVEERERSLKRQFAVIKDEMAVQNTELLETAKTIRALDHDAIPALSRLEPRLKKVVPESARSEVLSSPSGLMRTFPTIRYMESEAARGLQQKVSDLSRKSDLLSAEVKRLQEREKQLSNEKERALVELTKSRYGMSGVASPPRKPVPTAPRRDVGITPSAPVSKGSRTLRTPARPVRPAPVKPLGLVKKRVGVPKGGVSKDGLRHSGKANRKTLPRTSGKYKPPPPLPATPLVPKTPTRAAPVAKGQVVVPSPSAPIPVKVFPAQLGKQMDKQAAELLALITTVWLLQDEGRSEPPRKPGEKQDQWVEGCVKGALRHAVTYLTTCSGIMSAKKTLLQEVDGEAVKTTWISAENDAGIEAARTNYKLWEPTLAQEEWIVEKRVLCGLNVSIRTAMKATAAAQFSATIMYAKEIGRRALVDFDVVMGPSLHRKVGDTGNVASLAGAQTQPASDMAAALNPMSSLTYTPVRTTDRTSTPDSSTKATATRGSAPGSQATAPIPRLPESTRRTKGKAPNPVVPTATPILPAPTQVPRPQSAAGAKASLPSKPPTTSPSQLTSTTPAAGGRTIVPKTSPAQNQGAAVPAGPSAMKAEKITSQSKAADAPTPDKMKGVQTATAGVPSPEKAAVGAGASINARKSATDDAAGVQRGQVQSASSAGKGASAGAALEAVKGTDLVSDASGSASRPALNAVAKTSAPAGQVQPEKPKGPTGSDSRGSTILPAAPSSEMVPIPAQKPDVIEKTLVKPATEGSGAPGKKKASSQSGGQAGTKKSGGTAKSRSAGSRKSTKAGSASKAQPSSLKAAAGRDQATQQPAVASAVLGQQGSAEELPNTGSNRVYKARGKLSAQVTTSQIKAPPGTAQMRLPPVPTRRTAPSMRQDISVGAGDHSDPLLPGGGMSASGVPGVQGMDASDGSSLKARDVGIPRVGGKMPSAKPPKQGSGQKEGRASGNDRGATLLRGTPSSAAKGRKGSQNTLFQSTPRKQVGFKSIPQPGKRRSGLSNPSSPFDARVQAAYTPSFDSVPASQVTQPSQHQEEYRRPATSQELHTALGTGGAHEAYRERVDGGSGGMFPSGEGAYGTYGAAMHERGNELGHMDLMNPATPSAFPGLDGYIMNDSAVGLKRLPNEERESLPATPSDFPPDRVFPGALNSPINFERNYVTPENFGASRNPYGAGASFGPGGGGPGGGGPGGGGPGGGGPGGGGASGLGHLMNPQQQQQQGQAYRGQQFQHRAPFQRGGPR